ncbi:sensor histidine kinase [Denitromonas iodatirespirans]|uniref:histidine kinase n=1 Tax=Denitromonas iodatirespirans TaxID=2795389 RepID=A0A944DBN8_DENI1|nr:ATP-binding protein [Denitromonas iodatirespirans]MBT0962101.1 PAS domain-containing protein [Denitromonas iodatirespirans]
MPATRDTDPLSADLARRRSLRYLNLFRLVMAAVFLFFGKTIGLGEEAPGLFLGFAAVYLFAVLALGFPDAVERLGLNRVVTVQMLVDITALTLLMAVSGGTRGGLPMLLMVLLAGGGLVSHGRWVLFYAAVATLAVLAENSVRLLVRGAASDFFVVGMVCIGFFGVALMARLLAIRALANEALAQSRGADLARQQAINERIIEDMHDGAIVVDAELRVRQANPQAAALLGLPLPVGASMRELAPALAQMLADPAADCHQCRPDGGKPLRCRVVRAEGDGGHTIIYLQDLEAIQAQAQQIKLAALGRLTASIAHEIRNPLTAVTQAAELLSEEKRAESQARLIRIINDNALRIEKLVRDVLSLGRRDRALPEALPLAAFVTEVLDEFTLHGETEKAQVVAQIPPELTLAFDRAHLHQVLWNLLTNARRYASPAAGAIRVTAEREDGHTRLHVIDDGPGIRAEDRAHLFEPFFTTHAKGTGLGLYIARELADANRATLSLRDTATGAHFCLSGPSEP